MAKRLVKIAKDLNVGTSTIVEFLSKKGYIIDNKPTSTVSDKMYDELVQEFTTSIKVKERADKLIIGTTRPSSQVVDQLNFEPLNWELLPPGKGNWNEIREIITPSILNHNKILENQKLVVENIKFLRSFKPSFCAMGKKGFNGYIVFGFPHRKLYFMESFIWGNATYVFGENWEELSKLNKQEVLRRNLHKNRIFHKTNWRQNISSLLIL